ncbi:MAG: EAL domain-containing protein [Marinospirillum sp.]|uniref:putative bifunctional diguanylate cyclase/phosphodiesterase n=1 Tax=Marinospirillum sp. TaxID=2183934 RepID=UPI0019E9CE50|nr:EAL domain-containing protein [Marinospirillum sp.]MBE0507923.1 EAL domain-containing protein [Marinospirillum sp.]
MLTATAKASHEVRVGVYQNPPKLFFSERNEPRGILIELLQEIASREGWTLTFVPCEWSQCLDMLDRGQLDLMPDVAINSDRLQRFDFHTYPALNSWSQIYRHPDQQIESLLDLQGKRVAVLEGSIQEKALRQLLAGFEVEFRPVLVASLDQAFQAVAERQADAAIANYQFGGYRFADFGLAESPIVLMPARIFYVATQGRQTGILNRIDVYLERWLSEANSPYYQILRRWGGQRPETLVPRFLLQLLAGLVLLGVLLTVGMLLLRLQVYKRTRELAALNSHLEHLAHYDLLTDLPNRILLAQRLQQQMNRAQATGQQLLVALIDLDGFKQINDRYGNEVGDQLLIALTRKWRCFLSDKTLLGRMGGDEFVMVITGLKDQAEGMYHAEQFLQQLEQPVQLGELTLQVTGSMGLCFYPQQEQTIEAEQLLRQADQAMYQAKQAGKHSSQVFDAEWDRRIRGQHESLERVRQALNAQEFVLYYQPKVNLRTGQVVGAEALIRWQHPERGLLAPAAFLPLVEEQPLDAALGYWVLETAVRQMNLWQRAGHPLPVSVNISAYHLQQPDFVSRLEHLLQQYPEINPSDLEMEILETSALEDVQTVSAVMRACSRLGAGFALDDFGTGYSSLTYLRRLPAQLLKIDQSFVRDMLQDEDDLAILEGVIRLAAAFRRQVIAEGVETRRHGDELLKLGCELAQGYGIARPMPAAELPEWTRRWQQQAVWTA